MRALQGRRLPLRGADLVPVAMQSLWKRAGRRVVDAYHAPSVLPRPGIGVFFNRCGIRNNLVVSWSDRAGTEDEVTRVVEVVREEMGWSTAR